MKNKKISAFFAEFCFFAAWTRDPARRETASEGEQKTTPHQANYFKWLFVNQAEGDFAPARLYF